jgi:hypothetical protein
VFQCWNTPFVFDGDFVASGVKKRLKISTLLFGSPRPHPDLIPIFSDTLSQKYINSLKSAKNGLYDDFFRKKAKSKSPLFDIIKKNRIFERFMDSW